MLIVSQNGLKVVSLDKIQCLTYDQPLIGATLCGDGEAAFGVSLGKFSDENFARQVLADFVKAYSKGADFFQIPPDKQSK